MEERNSAQTKKKKKKERKTTQQTKFIPGMPLSPDNDVTERGGCRRYLETVCRANVKETDVIPNVVEL